MPCSLSITEQDKQDQMSCKMSCLFVKLCCCDSECAFPDIRFYLSPFGCNVLKKSQKKIPKKIFMQFSFHVQAAAQRASQSFDWPKDYELALILLRPMFFCNFRAHATASPHDVQVATTAFSPFCKCVACYSLHMFSSAACMWHMHRRSEWVTVRHTHYSRPSRHVPADAAVL